MANGCGGRVNGTVFDSGPGERQERLTVRTIDVRREL